MSLYSDYKYARPKRRSKSVLLFVFVIVACLVFGAVYISIGFRDEKAPSAKVELPALEFQALGTRGLSNKSKALELAHEIRDKGGAGFVDYDGEWFVLQEIVPGGNLTFSVESVEVTLVKREHREAFSAIIQSFEKNVMVLQGIYAKPAREVGAEALRLYNELADAITIFDRIQGATNSQTYSEVLVAANKQLLALYMLSIQKDTEDISSVLKHCMCSIYFARFELLTSLE